jgi:N6-adenosine-specific RNA methylase IME4
MFSRLTKKEPALTKYNRTVARVVPTIPAVLSKLGAMRKQVTSAKTYKELNRIEREAAAIKLLFKEVAVVKQEAELVILIANRRIADELAKVPKAGGPGRGKKQVATRRNVLGRSATGIPKDTRSRLGKLLTLSEKQLEARAKEIQKSGGDATPRAVLTTLKLDDIRHQRKSYDARADRGGKVSDLVSLAQAGQRFSVIYADPPWDVKTYSEKGQQKSAQKYYRTMTHDKIAALPIQTLAAKNCVLLMWVVSPMLPESLEVIKAWGFAYKTIGFNWVKQSSGGKGFTGLGFWTRAGSEICLLATRGQPKRMATDVMQVITAPVGKHSVKPEETRKRIERLVLGPYLELFARRAVVGWWTWGNEVAPPVPVQEAAE